MHTFMKYFCTGIILLSAGACASQEEQGSEEPDQSVVEETAEETGEAAEAVAEETTEIVDEAEDVFDDEVTVELTEADASGISGDADLRPSGGSTRVEVELDGLVDGTAYMARITSGICGSGGAEVARLEGFTAEGQAGGSTTALTPGTLGVGETYSIEVSTGTRIVACGTFEPEITG